MASRLIRLRFPASCAGCGAELAARTSAWWDDVSHTARCEACRAEDGMDAGPVSGPASDEPADQLARPASVAGGSAQREYERRHAKREQAIRARHPRLGGLILALTEDPQSTTAWARGAEGERRLGAGVDALAGAGIVALHDRRIPGSRANIDHLVVSPTGVWVIDAKRYRGQVARRDVGGWFSTDNRLYVGRRDCTKLVTAMSKQVAAVCAALDDNSEDAPVRPVLCFVDAEWGWFARPFELDGVLIAWPKVVGARLSRPGALSPERIDAIASQLEKRLPPAD